MKIKFTLLLVSMIITMAALSQGSWNAIAPFPDARFGAIGISVGGKGYVGLGSSDAGYHNDLWEYDPATNAWSPLANMPAPGRQAAIAFAINGKIYVGLGLAGFTVYGDLYEYDPATNTWSTKANYGGGPRYGAIAFSIGSKGYVGFGKDQGLTNGTTDFWEYDPVADAWEQRSGLPQNKSFGIGFSLGNKGYVGLGAENYDTRKKDFYQYDPDFNDWTRKRDFPGERILSFSFTIGHRAYAGAGYLYSPLKDLWEYNEVQDIWSPVTEMTGNGSGQGTAFAIGDKAYVGLGYDQQNSYNDFYAFHIPRTPVVLFDPINVTTYAGTGEEGYMDGPLAMSKFNGPVHAVIDADGNIYVSEHYNQRIRKIAPDGMVSTFAGSGVQGFADGNALGAQFNNPGGMAIDALGNIYVADEQNHRIRKITPAGMVTTIAGDGTPDFLDGPALSARFNRPHDVKIDVDGNLLVTDYENNRIRKIGIDGMVSTWIGNGVLGEEDGIGTAATLAFPEMMAFDSYGNLYVTEIYGVLRKITRTGMVNRVPLPNELAMFQYGISIDKYDNVYIGVNHYADQFNVFKISPNGHANVLAGKYTGFKDTIGIYAKFYHAGGLPVDGDNNIIATDVGRIRKLGKPDLNFSTVQGNPSEVKYFSFSAMNLKDDAVLTAPAGFELAMSTDGAFSSSLSVTPSNGEINVMPVFIRLNSISAGAFNGSVTLTSNGAETRYLPVTGSVIQPHLQFDPTNVTTLAGSGPIGYGEGGYQDGEGNNARFNAPFDVASDAAGNIYVADHLNHRIRKITPAGVVSTFAGTGVAGFADGNALSAQFAGPTGIAIDAAGNIFIADRNNHRIRKINTLGEVSTVAGSGVEGYLDGDALTAMFDNPFDVAVDSEGNIFVTDYENERIRKISTGGIVSTFAGNGIPSEENGIGTDASFIGPQFLAFDNYGGLYVTEIYGKLRKISPEGLVSSFQVPGFLDAFHYGVAVDKNDNLYVAVNPAADLDHIFKISPNGNAQIIAGGQAGYKDTLGVYAQFYYAFGITLDPEGNIIVADIHNNRVRKSGKPVLEFSSVQAIPSTEKTFSVSGVNLTADVNLSVPAGFEISLSPGGPYTGSLNLGTMNGEINLVPVYIRMNTSTALALSGNVVMNSAGAATQYLPIKGTIVKPALLFDPFVVTTLAGNGDAGFLNGSPTVARFNAPLDVARDALGNTYVADSKNNRIRRISPSGYVSTFAGSGLAGYVNGNAAISRFNQPNGVAVDGEGNVFVTEFGNRVIRRITAGGIVSTFAGSGLPGFSDGPAGSAQFLSPKDLVVDQVGNVFVVDQDNHAIRKITPAGQVITIAGNGTAGHEDGTGVSARFYYPQGIALDPYGNLWVTQLYGQLRKISPSGMVTTILTDGFIYGFRYGVVSDPASNIYVSVLIDDQENRIYKVTPLGTGALVAGGVNGFKDSTGADAKFSFPEGLTIDNFGSIYVADNGNNRIRKISTPSFNLSAIAGTASEARYFKVSGMNLGANAVISVPSAFEISLSPSGSFSSSISLSPVSGEFTSMVIYIRLKSTAGAGTYRGYITLSSPGALTRTLLVTGSVTDNVPPVVNCLSSLTLCYNSSNSYAIPFITATDQSAFRSFTYSISGATNRSGSGRNASGYFAAGTSTIVWRVTDIAGNVGTCTTTVRVDYRINVIFPDVLPNLVWGQTNTIYRGFGVPCAILGVLPSGGTPYPGLNGYRYRWSNGATTQTINVCPTAVGNHVYTVTITDALGCSVTVSKTINVVDVRCGPDNTEVTMCWFGTSQVCYAPWQAIIAMYYGAQIGPCSQYRTITTQAPLRKKEPEMQEMAEIKAYPNPNNGSFKLQFNNVQAKEIRVFDRDGKLVLQKAVVGVDKSGTMDINLGTVTKGVYLVQVIGEKGVHTVKVVVM